MKTMQNRRSFLADVSRGVVLTTVGAAVAGDLGLVHARADEPPASLAFGPLEPLVCLMQETPPDDLPRILADRLRTGTGLRELVAAGALANARTFGGEDYVGYHTLMALAPAYQMSREIAGPAQALPAFKVLHRNTRRIQEHGGRKSEVLQSLGAVPTASEGDAADRLRDAVRRRDRDEAERIFAGVASNSPEAAFNALLHTVQDETEVHRVVLPYRAWDLLDLVGREQAHTLLRQSVRYCLQSESRSRRSGPDDPRRILPEVMERHGLAGRRPGERTATEAEIEALCRTIFESSPSDAAAATGAALASGLAPDSVGEAITLAANQLVLRDRGRTPGDEAPGKPLGSVHGDSIGVHACDSANAWRNLARAANTRNAFACLILGASQVARDRDARGGDFLRWQAVPYGWPFEQVRKLPNEPARLLQETDEAIRGNLQARASALVHRYGELGHDPRPVFDLLLRFAVSEDGALHAEKFYRTCAEEFAASRPAWRWRHLVALARVTASEFGSPAPGVAESRTVLGIG